MNNDHKFYVEMNKAFYKINEDFKILNDQSFDIRGIDNNIKIDGMEFVIKHDGLHYIFYNKSKTFGEMKSVLPNMLVNRLEQLRTKSDVLDLVNDIGITYTSDNLLEMVVPVKINQNNVSEGYIRTDFIYFVNYIIEFEYDSLNNIINSMSYFNRIIYL